jgi:DNA-binding beta-propeller fold protein YncE
MTASLPPEAILDAGAPAPAPPVADDEAQRKRRRKAFLLLFLLGLLALLILLIVWYLLFRKPINPIPPIPVSQVPTYSTAIYGVTRPVGVAVSSTGDRIYVTQGGTASVGVVLDGGGTVLGKMTPPGSTVTDHQPVYVAIDPTTQEVYVSDRPTGTVSIYSRDGIYERDLILAVPRPGWQPVGLAFDAAGDLFVTDLSGPFQKVLEIDRAGKVLRTLGENEKLSFPNGVAVDDAGSIYVTDSDNGRILVFGSDGTGVVRVGRGAGEGSLGLPRGLAIDDSARIFAVDTTAQEVQIYRSPAATASPLDFLGSFGVPGIGDGQFNFPSSVATDSRGHVYVTDTFNDRVQLWSY